MDSIEYYNRYAIPYYERTVDLNMDEMLQEFMELLPENADVLDLGCGSGRDTLAMEEEGLAVTAMDGSEEMCKLASIHTGKDVLHLTMDEMEFDDVFHGIWACAVLGHVQPDLIEEIMKKMVRALKDDGILYFSVRKGDRNGLFNGRYFFDYDKESLYDLLDTLNNIEIVRVWKTHGVQSDNGQNEWYNVLLRKKI